MNFCPELLEGGRFAEAWIADVRGIANVKKKDVIKLDILELCKAIIEMLDNGRRPSEECLSLMLASRLVHGVFVLFDSRVSVLLDQVLKFSYKCRIPELRSPSESKKKEGDVVSKKRKRKGKAESSLPMDRVQVDQAAQDDYANVAPLASITINELPCEPVNEMDNMKSELLNFGDIGYSVQPDPLPSRNVVFPLSEDVESVQEHLPTRNDVLTTPTKKRSPTDILTTPTKKRTVEKLATELDDVENLITQLENPEMLMVEKPVTPLCNVEICIPPWEQGSGLENLVDPKSTKNKKQTPRKTKSLEPFCMNEKSNTRITRRLLNEIQDTIPEVDEIPTNFTRFSKHVSVDVASILAILFHDDPHIEDHIYRKQQSLSHVESLPGQNLASRHTTLHVADLPSIVEAPQEQSNQFMVPVEAHAPHFADPNVSGLEGKDFEVEVPHVQPHHITVPVEVHAPLCAETNIGREPLAKTLVMLPDQTEFFASAVEPAVVEESPFEVNVPENEELRKMLRHQRHKYIRHTVKYWNSEEKGKMTLEDVCPKPLNRFNVAATFGDLLTMSKHDYVVLIGNEDTLELETIEKGKRLLEE